MRLSVFSFLRSFALSSADTISSAIELCGILREQQKKNGKNGDPPDQHFFHIQKSNALGCTIKYLSLAVPRRCGAITCGSSLRLKELDSVNRSWGGGLAPSSFCLCGVHVSERAGCNRQAFGRVGIGERSFIVGPAVLTPGGLAGFIPWRARRC